MSTISIQDLEQDPRGVLRRVEAGESITIVRGDRAVAEVRPSQSSDAGPRPVGLASGQFEVPDDFDADLPEEIMGAFEGR